MSWDEVGAIGQVLGSIAVFITLGYLAIQVGHMRQERQRSLSQGRADAVRDMFMHQMNNERVSGLLLKANDALGTPPSPFRTELMRRTGLSAEDANVIEAYVIAWWQFRVHVISHVDELPPGERAEFDLRTRMGFGTPSVWQLFYRTMPGLNSDVVRYIDNLLARPG